MDRSMDVEEHGAHKPALDEELVLEPSSLIQCIAHLLERVHAMGDGPARVDEQLADQRLKVLVGGSGDEAISSFLCESMLLDVVSLCFSHSLEHCPDHPLVRVCANLLGNMCESNAAVAARVHRAASLVNDLAVHFVNSVDSALLIDLARIFRACIVCSDSAGSEDRELLGRVLMEGRVLSHAVLVLCRSLREELVVMCLQLLLEGLGCNMGNLVDHLLGLSLLEQCGGMLCRQVEAASRVDHGAFEDADDDDEPTLPYNEDVIESLLDVIYAVLYIGCAPGAGERRSRAVAESVVGAYRELLRSCQLIVISQAHHRGTIVCAALTVISGLVERYALGVLAHETATPSSVRAAQLLPYNLLCDARFASHLWSIASRIEGIAEAQKAPLLRCVRACVRAASCVAMNGPPEAAERAHHAVVHFLKESRSAILPLQRYSSTNSGTENAQRVDEVLTSLVHAHDCSGASAT